MKMKNYHFDDFTENKYRDIVRQASLTWKFLMFADFLANYDRKCLWRHDIDYSVHRALQLAKIEAEVGVRSTYFVLLHSEFYNLFEYDIVYHVKEILEMGHKIGLHFEASFYGKQMSHEQLIYWMHFERKILEQVFSAEVDVFSWHNPDQQSLGDLLIAGELAGMLNTYGAQISESYSYISDSNGYWRYRRLPEVVASGADRNLHVLTHPEWWTPDVLSPGERIQRCISGRAASQQRNYDNLLEAAGRINIYEQ